MNRQDIFLYVKTCFDTIPDYPWKKFPNYGVLRHKNNRKWFGVLMDVHAGQLNLPISNRIDILNIKLHPEYVCILRQRDGFLPAYHMNQEHWVSILLNNSVSADELKYLIKQSFDLTVNR